MLIAASELGHVRLMSIMSNAAAASVHREFRIRTFAWVKLCHCLSWELCLITEEVLQRLNVILIASLLGFYKEL